jgi:hypothetical protein
MSTDSLAVALMALDDPGVRDKVRSGDFSGFHPDVVLSSKEEQLVKAAAEEESDPEVAGYDASSSALFNAASTVPGGVISAPVAGAFQSYMSTKFGHLGSAMAGPCACPPMSASAFGSYQQ